MEKINLTQEEIAEKIEIAQNAARSLGRTLVTSLFETVDEEQIVRIALPSINAKYLEPVPAHKILVFADETLDTATQIDVNGHYVHGDMTARDKNGKVRPIVVRHLHVNQADFGQTIVALVRIKYKYNLQGEVTMVIIDILQRYFKAPVTVENVLKIGVKAAGASKEAKIPGTDLCVRFEKTKALMMRATKEKTEVLFTPKSEATV